MAAVKRSALRGTESHVVIAVEVARRQLSQWQLSVHLGSASYENLTAPQRQCPVVIFLPSCAGELRERPRLAHLAVEGRHYGEQRVPDRKYRHGRHRASPL